MERFDNKMLLHPEENMGTDQGHSQDLKVAHLVRCHQSRCCSPARLAGQGFTCVAETPAWLEEANMFGKVAPDHCPRACSWKQIIQNICLKDDSWDNHKDLYHRANI